MINKFKFEKEANSGTGPMPLSIQYRLDSIGVKISPETWNHLSGETRLLFSHFGIKPAEEKERYRTYVLYLAKRLKLSIHVMESYEVERARAEWENLTRIPPQVYQMVVDLDFTLSPKDWIRMSDFKRYALVNLSRGNHARAYLNKAMSEMLGAESKVTAWKSRSGNHPDASLQLIKA